MKPTWIEVTWVMGSWKSDWGQKAMFGHLDEFHTVWISGAQTESLVDQYQ